MNAADFGQPRQDESTFDGLRRLRNSLCTPWLMVLMGVLFILYKNLLLSFPAAMTGELMHYFHLNAAGLGYLSSCYIYSFVLVQCFAGLLLERYCAKWVTAMAICLLGISVYGFAQATLLWQAILWRVLMGVFCAFATVNYLKLVATWFSSRHYPFLVGLVGTSAGIGVMLGQIPIAYGVDYFGWQTTLLISAWIGLCFSCFYGVLVSSQAPHRALPPGEPSSSQNHRKFPLMMNCKVWMLTAFCGLCGAPLTVFCALWGDPFLRVVYHYSRIDAASLVSLAMLGFAIGGPFWGVIVTWLNQRFIPVMLLGWMLALGAAMTIIFSPSLSGTTLAIALFLFGMGTAVELLVFSLSRQLLGTKNASLVVGVINSGIILLGALSEPLVGGLLDYFGEGMTIDGEPYFSAAVYRMALAVLVVYLMGALGALYGLHRQVKSRVDTSHYRIKSLEI